MSEMVQVPYAAILGSIVSGERSHLTREEAAACLAAIEHLRSCLSESSLSWVPVSERMPLDGQTVLGFWPTSGGEMNPQCWAVTMWAGGRWRNVDYHDDCYGDASHWMPLPEAPKP